MVVQGALIKIHKKYRK